MWARLLSIALLIGCLTTPAFSAPTVTTIQGAYVRNQPVATNITTNTTTNTSPLMPNGAKTFFGEVVCTSGACTQTQAIYGAANNTNANGVLLCTLTLSATPRAQDACPVVTAAFPYFYVITTNTTGTSATGAVYVQY